MYEYKTDCFANISSQKASRMVTGKLDLDQNN